MTNQRETELTFMQRGINEFSLKLDDYYLESFQYGFEKESVRDVSKHSLEMLIDDMSFVRFAKNLIQDIETQKQILRIVKQYNFEELEAYKGEYEDQLNWLKILKRVAEPILEKKFLLIKNDVTEDILDQYKKELKGFKFITKYLRYGNV